MPDVERPHIDRQFQSGTAVYLASVLRMGESQEDDVRTAQSIIDDFGTLNAVLSAPEYELLSNQKISRSGARNIAFVKRVLQEGASTSLKDLPLLTSADKYIRYLTQQVGYSVTEEVHVLLLGRDMSLLSDHCLSRGTSSHVSIDAKTILAVALKGGASSIVVSHNHPSGDPAPSQDDLVLTSKIADGCTAIGLRFVDHIIVAKDRWYSFRLAGHV